MQLTAMDIHQLIKEPSSVSRGALASKVAVAFRSGDFNAKESAIAADIFRLVLKDAEKNIRETLAQNLFDSPNAPHDVIFKLACDDDNDVAARVLEYSLVLTEEDLLAVIKSTKEVLRLSAVARRAQVSGAVSDALLDTQQVAVLSDLFKNKGAVLGEQALTKNWQMIASHNNLLETLVMHGGLPLTIAERVYHSVSDEMKRHVARQYKINSPVVHKAANDAREWQMLGLAPMGDLLSPDDDERVEDLVDQLFMSGRLTHSFIIRALCSGSLNLFETGIARLAGVPRINARILIMGGANGFHAIYKTANMPEGFADGVEKLLNIALEQSQFGYAKPEEFSKRVVEQIYIKGYQHSVENMPYLLSIIGGKLSRAAMH